MAGYVPPTPEELVVSIREQREKCLVLHEERGKQWHVAREADHQHQFLVDASDAAEREYSSLRHALTAACERQAQEMVA